MTKSRKTNKQAKQNKKSLLKVNFCQVETRDVLGNIKGTFGFVDADGEIKRVSYSSSNGTGFKSTTMSPLQEHVSVVQSIPRLNRTLSSSTRRPNIVYSTTTAEPVTKSSSVVQSIPRTRRPIHVSSTTISSTSTDYPETTTRITYGNYPKTTRGRPRFIINGQQRPPSTVDSDSDSDSEDSQINRPSTEKPPAYRRILFAKRPVDHNLRPISEEFVEREDDVKITGNTLRRQLHEETTKTTPVVEDNTSDEHHDVYGGTLSTTRPLFTTTSPAVKILQQRLRASTDRPKTIFQETLGPARFNNVKYQNEEAPRVYEAEAKSAREDAPQQILVRTTPRVPIDQVGRQTSEPVAYVSRQHPDHYMRELPILIPERQSNGEEDPTFRAIPIGRLVFRPLTPRPVYTTTPDNVQYVTEQNSTPEPEETTSAQPVTQPEYIRPRPFLRPLVYAEPQEGRTRPLLRPVAHPVTQAIDEREYARTVAPEYAYRTTTIALPPEPPNSLSPIAQPLSRRDFQILLRRLLVSQYGIQALTYPKAYLEDALLDQMPYPTYQQPQPAYQTPIPRQPEVAYEHQPLPYGERVPLRRPPAGYTRVLNPLYQQPQQYEDYPEAAPAARYPKRVYRQKFYTHEDEDGDEVLPAPVREALLLRMLQLAINVDRPAMTPTVAMATLPTTPRYRKLGPVRSVQIIGTSEEEEKDARKKL